MSDPTQDNIEELPQVEVTPINETPKVTVTDEEKEKYFKCFLGELPYEEEFSLFDGRFKVKFKTLSVEENDDVLKQISADNKKSQAGVNDQYFFTILLYRLGLSIVSINNDILAPDINKQNFDPNSGFDSYVQARSKLFDAWPVFKLAGIQEIFRQFEQKVLVLNNEISNPSFWKAAV